MSVWGQAALRAYCRNGVMQKSLQFAVTATACVNKYSNSKRKQINSMKEHKNVSYIKLNTVQRKGKDHSRRVHEGTEGEQR